MPGRRLVTALPPMVSRRFRHLLHDTNGFPIPWHVAVIAGRPAFGLLRDRAVEIASSENRCWVCGHRLGTYLGFAGDVATAITRVALQPPSHRDCLLEAIELGIPAMRSPGVRLVWVTRNYDPAVADDGRTTIWRLGPPRSTRWFLDGRAATHDEVSEAMAEQLPALFESAHARGEATVKVLERQAQDAVRLLPSTPPHVESPRA